jgi:importin subunit alpha-6/7
MLQVFTAYVECRHPSASVLIPALRTVGNIVTGDDLQTQVNSMTSQFF